MRLLSGVTRKMRLWRRMVRDGRRGGLRRGVGGMIRNLTRIRRLAKPMLMRMTRRQRIPLTRILMVRISHLLLLLLLLLLLVLVMMARIRNDVAVVMFSIDVARGRKCGLRAASWISGRKSGSRPTIPVFWRERIKPMRINDVRIDKPWESINQSNVLRR